MTKSIVALTITWTPQGTLVRFIHTGLPSTHSPQGGQQLMMDAVNACLWLLDDEESVPLPVATVAVLFLGAAIRGRCSNVVAELSCDTIHGDCIMAVHQSLKITPRTTAPTIVLVRRPTARRCYASTRYCQHAVPCAALSRAGHGWQPLVGGGDSRRGALPLRCSGAERAFTKADIGHFLLTATFWVLVSCFSL